MAMQHGCLVQDQSYQQQYKLGPFSSWHASAMSQQHQEQKPASHRFQLLSRKRGPLTDDDDEELHGIKRHHVDMESITQGILGWSGSLASPANSPHLAPNPNVSAGFEGRSYFEAHTVTGAESSGGYSGPGIPGISRSIPNSPSSHSWDQASSFHGHGHSSLIQEMSMDIADKDGPGISKSEFLSMPAAHTRSSSCGPSFHAMESSSILNNVSTAAKITKAEPKASGSGRLNIVIGYRPSCERCQRKEKGHYAHFE